MEQKSPYPNQEAVKAELQRIYDTLDRSELRVDRASEPFQGTDKVEKSIFPVADESYQPWALIEAAAVDEGCGAAIGSLVGLAIGDSVGHPLEFLPVNDDPPEEDGTYIDESFLYPTLITDPETGERSVQYHEPHNKFCLSDGQWTDDCSMALCLADSLLVRKSYHGGDARTRWHLWWNSGYNNCFRYDPMFDEKGGKHFRPSVGLGGNIAMSILEVDQQSGKTASQIDGLFSSRNEDAGNGSIMRLAPVPICFHYDLQAAEMVADLQSRATHPGNDAAACCKFITFLVIKAIDEKKAGRSPGDDVRKFMTDIIDQFIASRKEPHDTGMQKVIALLKCQPPSEKEINWKWDVDQCEISTAIQNRRRSPDGRYNGYPVIPTYWGAYSLDGLAMCLWALWNTTSFTSCIVRVINLLGDADTTGAICGQMAGAIYGWKGIIEDDMSRVMLNNCSKWDRQAEIPLRAAMLYHIQPQAVLSPGSILGGVPASG
eukprot:TRINITY_DN11904_c0_g2_i1.p1 TRINITY_DN11904_c0_g2~~TRINITY_DN11904_c0_g2_i1.p1  ORF type:complete len:488 (+),score=80.15 TRINITY_DN11904_c0_g2_i1:48-1511(+)